MDKYFVVVRVDVEEQGAKQSLNTPGGEELYQRLGGGKGGVPFFAFLSAAGDLIVNTNEPPGEGRKGGNIGHPFEPHEVDWFMTMLSKAVPAMTADERGAMEKYLRSQKK
ncbi:MAG TPA: hypothetical protein VKX45_16520 [Bryobacteraceae bacterium]|nr:hypothetical protein [Bryobacteraceae bacterium]